MEFEKKNPKLDNIDEQNFSVRQSENPFLQDEFALKKSKGGSTMNINVFRKDFLAVTFDKALKKASTFRLYHVMRGFADMRTHEVIISIRKIAKQMDCDRRTVQRNLAILIDMGLITRTLRKAPYDPRMNLASHFVVHDIDAERYADLLNENVDVSARKICRPITATIVPPPSGKSTAQEFKEGFEKDLQKENNKNKTENISTYGEINVVQKSDSKSTTNEIEESDSVITSNSIKEQNSEFESITTEKSDSNSETEAIIKSNTKEKSTNKTENSSADAFNRNETVNSLVNYLIARTGRKKLIEAEYKILEELSDDKELPKIAELIIKLIDETIERFIRKGKKLSNVTFCYIAKVLESRRYEKKAKNNSKEKNNQTPRKHPSKRQTKQNSSELKIKPELTMPVEEAEKVITNYAQEKEQAKTLPVALREIFEKIQLKNNELADKSETLTLEEYLHIQFPEAEDEELHRDFYGNVHENYTDFPQRQSLEDAFKIDFACAMCENPSNCSIPKEYKQSLKKCPHVEMCTDKDEKKFLGTRYENRVKCKYGVLGKTKEEMELKSRIKESGLTAMQVNQTFETFHHQNANDEIIVAKAQAMLAVKNRSNLILAGKPGTGKSHLASAIALEAMKNGQSARFKSLPELLDEICCAYQNNADPFGLMLRYKTVPCLILDDWGKEKTTDARMDYLFQIIDYRYRNGLQTILTTNALNAEGLKNHWNADKIEPLVSRILENGQWVAICEAENHRLKKFSKPEAIEPKTYDASTLTEATTVLEAQDSQKIYEAETEVLDKTPSDVVSIEVDEAEKIENFSEPEISHESVPSAPKTEAPTTVREKSSDKPCRISEIFSRSQSKEMKPEIRSWDEIAQSPEFQKMSVHDRILAKWEYVRETPEYKSLDFSEKFYLQKEFAQLLTKPEKYLYENIQQIKGSGNIITAPQYDDDLDDDDNELNL